MTQEEFDALPEGEKTRVILEESIKGIFLSHNIGITMNERTHIVAETINTREAHKIINHMEENGLERERMIPLAIISTLLAVLSKEVEAQDFEAWAISCLEQAMAIRERLKGNIRTVKVVMPPPGEGMWN